MMAALYGGFTGEGNNKRALGRSSDQICHINYELTEQQINSAIREWMPYADNLWRKMRVITTTFFAAVLMLWCAQTAAYSGQFILLRGIRILASILALKPWRRSKYGRGS